MSVQPHKKKETSEKPGMPEQEFKTSNEILEHFDLTFEFSKFFDADELSPVPPDEKFLSQLEFSLMNRGAADKEAYTCEFLIVPFLREVWQRHPENLSLFSHITLKVDEFHLIPDYVISSRSPRGLKILHRPLLLTIEAKDEKFEQGWVQALLQLLACQRMNKSDKLPVRAIVTTGDIWQFGKIEERRFTRHPLPISIENPGRLLGVLDHFFSECERAIETYAKSGFADE